MALPALPSNPASSLPSDLNDDNDHFDVPSPPTAWNSVNLDTKAPYTNLGIMIIKEWSVKN